MTKRIVLAIGFPPAIVLIYFFELKWKLGLLHIVQAVFFMLVISTCIFILAPKARWTRRVWLPHILVWVAAIGLAAAAIPFWWQGTSPWAFPLLFFAIHIPVIHLICAGSWINS